MVVRGYSKSMVSFVENILEEYDAGAFHDYWKLSREIIDEFPIRRFYVHLGQSNVGFYSRPNYLNVVILADNFIADVEGSIRASSNWGYSSNEQGGFVITPLKSIEAIQFHKRAALDDPGIIQCEVNPDSDRSWRFVIGQVLDSGNR